MGEQYLYQKFPFLSQKKRSCLKYIFGLLHLFTTYRMPLKVTVLRIPRFRNNFLFFVFILPSDWCKSYSFRRKCNIMKKSKQKRNLPVIQDNNLFCWRYCLGDIP